MLFNPNLDDQDFAIQMKSLIEELGVMYQILKRQDQHFFKESDPKFIELSQDLIRYTRPIIDQNYMYSETGQLSQLIGVELYFKLYEFNEENAKILIKSMKL